MMATDIEKTKPPPSVDDAIAAIRAYIRLKGWTIYKLAEVANLPRGSLRFIDSPNWAPSTGTLRVLHAMLPPDFDPASVPDDLELPERLPGRRRKPPHYQER